jgi:hypothetical protein
MVDNESNLKITKSLKIEKGKIQVYEANSFRWCQVPHNNTQGPTWYYHNMIRVIIQLVQGKRYKIYNHIIRFSKFSFIFFIIKVRLFLITKVKMVRLTRSNICLLGKSYQLQLITFLKLLQRK